MKWLRKLLGTDFPDPQVGQVWRSRNSGDRMLVSGIRTTHSGIVVVTVKHEMRGVWNGQAVSEFCGIGDEYAYGLDQWRRSLRDEARELVTL